MAEGEHCGGGRGEGGLGKLFGLEFFIMISLKSGRMASDR